MGLFRRKSHIDKQEGAGGTHTTIPEDFVQDNDEEENVIDYSTPTHSPTKPENTNIKSTKPILRTDHQRRYKEHNNVAVYGTPDTAPNEEDDDDNDNEEPKKVVKRGRRRQMSHDLTPSIADMHITVQQEQKKKNQHHLVNHYNDDEDDDTEVDGSTISDLSASLYRPPSRYTYHNRETNPHDPSGHARSSSNQNQAENNALVDNSNENTFVTSMLNSAMGVCQHPTEMISQGLFPTPHTRDGMDFDLDITTRGHETAAQSLRRQQPAEGKFIRPPIWGIAPSESDDDDDEDDDEKNAVREATDAADTALLDRSGEYESIELVLETPLPATNDDASTPERKAREQAESLAADFRNQVFDDTHHNAMQVSSGRSLTGSPKRVTIAPEHAPAGTAATARSTPSKIPLCQPVNSTPTSYPPPRGIYSSSSPPTSPRQNRKGKHASLFLNKDEDGGATDLKPLEENKKTKKKKKLKGITSLFRKSKKSKDTASSDPLEDANTDNDPMNNTRSLPTTSSALPPTTKNKNDARSKSSKNLSDDLDTEDGVAGSTTASTSSNSNSEPRKNSYTRDVVGILRKPRLSKASVPPVIKEDTMESEEESTSRGMTLLNFVKKQGDSDKVVSRQLSFSKQEEEKQESKEEEEDSDSEYTDDSYPWRQVKDAGTGKFYYYHIDSKATTWKKPEGWDEHEAEYGSSNDEEEEEEKKKKLEGKKQVANANKTRGVATAATERNTQEEVTRNIAVKTSIGQSITVKHTTSTATASQSIHSTDSQSKKEAVAILTKISPDTRSNSKLLSLYSGREEDLVQTLENVIEETPFDEQGDMSGAVRDLVDSSTKQHHNNGEKGPGMISAGVGGGQERALPTTQTMNHNGAAGQNHVENKPREEVVNTQHTANNVMTTPKLTAATLKSRQLQSQAPPPPSSTTGSSTFSAGGINYNTRVRSETTHTTGLTGLLSNVTDVTKQVSNTTRGIFLNSSDHSNYKKGRSMTPLGSTAESMNTSVDTNDVGLMSEESQGGGGEQQKRYILDFENGGPGAIPARSTTSESRANYHASTTPTMASTAAADHNARTREIKSEEFKGNDFGLKAEKYGGSATIGGTIPSPNALPSSPVVVAANAPHPSSSNHQQVSTSRTAASTFHKMENNRDGGYAGDDNMTQDNETWGSDSVSALSMSEGDFGKVNLRAKKALKQRMNLKGAIEKKDWEKAASMADDLSKTEESLRSHSTFEAASNDIYQRNIISNENNGWTQTDLDKFISQNDWGAVSNYISKMRQTQDKACTPPANIATHQRPSVTKSVMQCINPTLVSEEQAPPPTQPKNVPRKRFGARSQLQHDYIDDDNWDYENDSLFGDTETSDGESSYSRRRRSGATRRRQEKMDYRKMQV